MRDLKRTSAMLFDLWMVDGRRDRRSRAVLRRPIERHPADVGRDARRVSIEPWA